MASRRARAKRQARRAVGSRSTNGAMQITRTAVKSTKTRKTRSLGSTTICLKYIVLRYGLLRRKDKLSPGRHYDRSVMRGRPFLRLGLMLRVGPIPDQ